MKRFTLELGGKSPMIVLPDANLETTIAGTAVGIFANHGQNCCAGSRLFVHESIYDKVVDGIAAIAAGIKLGSPLVSTTQMGPLVSSAQQQRVLSYMESGKSEGAEVLVGGTAPGGRGSYLHPTVMVNAQPSMKMVREEIFGPVLVAARFSQLDEVLNRANDTQFGLGASVWTTNISKAHRCIQALRSGTVWVNTHGVLDLAVPFGGMKQSGVGHELGEEAIKQHTHLKAAVVAL
jgi:phenylacetaldehyde dehydrogenase